MGNRSFLSSWSTTHSLGLIIPGASTTLLSLLGYFACHGSRIQTANKKKEKSTTTAKHNTRTNHNTHRVTTNYQVQACAPLPPPRPGTARRVVYDNALLYFFTNRLRKRNHCPKIAGEQEKNHHQTPKAPEQIIDIILVSLLYPHHINASEKRTILRNLS